MTIRRLLSTHLSVLFRRVLFSGIILLTFLFLYFCLFLLIDVDFTIFLYKVKCSIFCKSIHSQFFRCLEWCRCSGGLILTGIFYLFDPESVSQMMAHSGASGGSGSESTVNQPAHPHNNIGNPGVVKPAEGAPNNNNVPNPNHDVVQLLEAINKKLRNLLREIGNPLKDSSAIFDISDRIVHGNPDRLPQALVDLEQRGTESPFFHEALRAKGDLDNSFFFRRWWTNKQL